MLTWALLIIAAAASAAVHVVHDPGHLATLDADALHGAVVAAAALVRPDLRRENVPSETLPSQMQKHNLPDPGLDSADARPRGALSLVGDPVVVPLLEAVVGVVPSLERSRQNMSSIKLPMSSTRHAFQVPLLLQKSSKQVMPASSPSLMSCRKQLWHSGEPRFSFLPIHNGP